MRLAALERVVTRCCGFYVLDVSDEGWTAATRESRWFRDGDELSRRYVEIDEGVLLDRQGNLVFLG